MAALAFAGVSCAAPAPGAEIQFPHHRLAALRPIDIELGINRIAHFAVDGRPARVILAWRGNGNAHSYGVYMVVMPGGEQDTDWNIVGMQPADLNDAFLDTIDDDPHTGEDYVRSIRFAHGLLDGKPETLLLSARRDWQNSIPESSIVVYDIYKLVHETEDFFGTKDQFQFVDSMRSTRKFCNSDVAMSQQFGFAVPGYLTDYSSKGSCT